MLSCCVDASPRKRGPKPEVEALLKRVDELEQKLRESKELDVSPLADEPPLSASTEDGASNHAPSETQEDASSAEPQAKRIATEIARVKEAVEETAVCSLPVPSEPSPGIQAEVLLDTYFSRFHAKPFHILDESTVRQRMRLKHLPLYLVHAIHAVGARYAPHPSGYQSAVQLSEEYASQARKEVDTDEPSVDALQALLLLVTAFTAAGKGKKAYMLLTNAVGIAMALELHREVELNARITPVEREMRRRLFWTCYLLGRFMACGSKRPSLIADKTIFLRLPYWSPSPSAIPIEGEFFQSDSNLQHLQGSGKKCQGSSGMLIDISRILGITNRYLAAGGVKGNSHFPWHSLSNLSKIRQHLDVWASGTNDVFSSVDALFGQPDSTTLVLSKLIYHLIHCLVYRPFIPIDLAELAGSGQHQSWQIEATNMCFSHANAIAEFVELGKQAAAIEWPAFVGYCIFTAGTVHIHGAHYNKLGTNEMSAFASSADFLSREMQQLSEVRYAWASVQHEQETLQGIYDAHSELVKSVTNNPMRHAPLFHLEDFFDRYANIGGPRKPEFTFDPASLSLSDVVVDFVTDTYTGQDLYTPRNSMDAGVAAGMGPTERPNLKRKSIGGANGRKRPDIRNLTSLQRPAQVPPTPGLPMPAHHSFAAGQTPNIMLQSPRPLPSDGDYMVHHSVHLQQQHNQEDATAKASVAAAAAADFSLSPPQPAHHSVPNMPVTPFSPQYNFESVHGHGPLLNGRIANDLNNVGYDPMFGGMPTNAFTSPAAWHGDENNRRQPTIAHNPGAASHNGSAGTSPGEESDPFLSLLGQLSENESAPGQRNDLDFFLNGAQI